MEPILVPMRDEGALIPGGGHDSDSWEVDAPWHFHDMHQILHAFDGSVTVEDERSQHRIPRQFAAWIPAGLVHRTRIQKVRSGSIFLRADLVPDAGQRLRVIAAPGLLREMIAHARRWPVGRRDDPAPLFFGCVASLCPEWIMNEVALSLPSPSNQRVAAVLDHMRANLATVTFPQACQAAGLSERSLRRKFLAHAGMTWGDCRRRMRVVEAMNLMEAGNLTIGAIAAKVGYESQAAFARIFREATGLSPAAYRRSRNL